MTATTVYPQAEGNSESVTETVAEKKRDERQNREVEKNVQGPF